MATSKGKAPRTIGGKFNSTGGANDQEQNRALIAKLIGEIGQDGYDLLPSDDKLLLTDTRGKLSDRTASMFGWRQVEAIVRIHTFVMNTRHAHLDPKITAAPLFVQALSMVQWERARAIVLHGPLKSGVGRWERLISEEYQEVMDELATVQHFNTAEKRVRAMNELAQLSQLCMGIIELLLHGKTEEEK